MAISTREVFDVFYECGEATCYLVENGSYVIHTRDTCNVYVDNHYGLHGWGFQGHHGIKGLYGNRNTFSRADLHSFGYDTFFRDLTMKDRQVNLQRGSEWSIEKLRLYITRTSGDAVEYFLNYAIDMRQNHASDCNGILNIDGVTMMWDRGLLAWCNMTRPFNLVRIIDTANSPDQGIDSKLPPTIIIRNIVFDLAGIQTGRPNDNFEFCTVTASRPQFTDYTVIRRKTLLPDNATVDGTTAIGVQPTQNAAVYGIKLPADLYQNTVGSRNKKGSDGTSARITLCNLHSVINNPSAELTAAQTVDIPGDAVSWAIDYLNSDYNWIPRIALGNYILAAIRTPDAKAITDTHSGELTRVYTNGNGNRCRVTSVDIRLIPGASSVAYFTVNKMLVMDCSWLNPASGVTYPDTLRGSGDEMIGESVRAPNLPAKTLIEE